MNLAIKFFNEKMTFARNLVAEHRRASQQLDDGASRTPIRPCYPSMYQSVYPWP
jgi:hypothetical protein